MEKHLFMTVLFLTEALVGLYGNIMQPDLVVSVHEGDTVALPCFFSTKESMVLWYKQVTGKNPHLIASSVVLFSDIRFHNEFDSSHFELLRGTASFNLKIVNTVQSDSATYYCATSFSNIIVFGNGTRLVIKGTEICKPANLQLPEFKQVESGKKRPLHCTIQNQLVKNEQSLYWFSHGTEESPPAFIYIHENSSKSCVGSSESERLSPTCMYKLPMKTSRSSEKGMYHCALATCGQALFGNTDTLSSQNTHLLCAVGLLVLLTLNVTINIVLCCMKRNDGEYQQIMTTEDDVSVVQYEEVDFKTFEHTAPPNT